MADPNSNSRIILPTRRSFVAATAAAAASLAVGGQNAHGFLFRQSSPISFESLPREWVKRQGESKIQSYFNYLNSLRLRHVTPLQVIKAHAKKRGSVWNTLPPKSMWRSMGGTLKATDRVAAVVGQPVRQVTSAYRSPAYNRLCPGAKTRSWHMQNFALDLQFNASTNTVARAAHHVRSKGGFKGGIGRYSTFVHIDTRGQNVDW